MTPCTIRPAGGVRHDMDHTAAAIGLPLENPRG
jgi:hypothetical protein